MILHSSDKDDQLEQHVFKVIFCSLIMISTNARPLKSHDLKRALLAYLDAKARFHQVELVHQFLVEGPHVLGNELLMHGEAVLQDVCLQNRRP